MSLSEYKNFSRELALLSGDLICKYYFRNDLLVDQKADESPVTIADREAERLIREQIEKHYPDHGIIGEEFGNVREDAEFVWVLDPIDGTISFAAGCPLFGTLICLMQGGRPILGVIHQPVLKQLCIGTPEETRINDEPVRVRSCLSLDQATLLTTDVKNIARHKSIAGYAALAEKSKIVRTWGDCYGYLLLARGGADIMMDPIMNPWDLLALVPIIQGAGGAISSWEGGDVLQSNSCVATAKEIHQEVIKILNQAD